MALQLQPALPFGDVAALGATAAVLLSHAAPHASSGHWMGARTLFNSRQWLQRMQGCLTRADASGDHWLHTFALVASEAELEVERATAQLDEAVQAPVAGKPRI